MSRRALAWAEMGALFLLLYAGIPWSGLQFDSAFRIPPWSAAVRWSGLGLLFVGLLGLGWCFTLFALVGRGTPNPTMPPTSLVTMGPYAWTRNPLALSHAAALIGLSAALGSVSGVVIVLILWVPVHFAMLREERTLEARFGEAYRAYRAAVPRWVPRLSRRQR